jgi:hypothetical protein
MMKEPMKSMLTKRPITPIDNIDLLMDSHGGTGVTVIG